MLGGIAGVAVGGFGPLVRHEAALVADRMGGAITIEHVFPQWRGVSLRDVNITLEEIPGAKFNFDEIDIQYNQYGRSVVLRGGKITAVGPRDIIVQQFESWRSNYLQSGSSESQNNSKSSSSVRIDGIEFAWQNSIHAPTESLTAQGICISKEEPAIRITANKASLLAKNTTFSLEKAELVIEKNEGHYQVAGLSARDVEAELAAFETSSSSADNTISSAANKSKANIDAATENKTAPRNSLAVSSIGEFIQTRAFTLARNIDRVIKNDAKIGLSRVNIRVKLGSEKLHLGPGAFSIRREREHILLELSPSIEELAAQASAPSDKGNEALTFLLSIPIQSDANENSEIEADVRGGPIWLSALGIHDGDLGLFDVNRTSIDTRAHLVLSKDGREVRIEGDGKLKNLSIRHDALSEEPVSGLDLSWRAKALAALDGSRIYVDDGEIDVGAIQFILRGKYDRMDENFRLRASVDVPLLSCQAMMDSIPKGLVPTLLGVRMAGSLAMSGHARFDTSNLDKDFDVDWDVSNSCRIVEAPPEVNASKFRRPFKLKTYGQDGGKVELDTGPGSGHWVPYGAISKFMEVAVLTTEDGGFHRHRGFDYQAIRNSIREDLRKRKFVRGASTISMQLAKNLYLGRAKNLARKLQEAIFTMYLEQELTKEQIMEIYLNVVEFGPMIYGIGQAARHYFNTSASQLSLGQSLYLSSILPNPKKQYFGAGGAVVPQRMDYLRKLMQLAYERKRISEEELEEALPEIVVRGMPIPPRKSTAGEEPSNTIVPPAKPDPETPRENNNDSELDDGPIEWKQ